MCYADFTCLHVCCVHACLQEYGITTEEKLHIAQNYCSPFLRKIRSDFLQVINSSTEDSTTRLDSRYSFCVVVFLCVCSPQCISYCYRGVHTVIQRSAGILTILGAALWLQWFQQQGCHIEEPASTPRSLRFTSVEFMHRWNLTAWKWWRWKSVFSV